MIREGTWLRQKIDRLLYKNCILPNIKMELDTAEILCQLSSQGMGITFLAEQLIRITKSCLTSAARIAASLSYLRPRHGLPLAIGYNRNQYLSSLAMSLIDCSKLKASIASVHSAEIRVPGESPAYAQELGLSATDA
jgi:DNA-binding transcriptional LysR family regulator